MTAFIPAVTRSRRASLSNCANAANIVSINWPLGDPRLGLASAGVVGLSLAAVLVWAILPPGSPMRAPDGSVAVAGSRLMPGLIPLTLVLTIGPSLASLLRSCQWPVAGV